MKATLQSSRTNLLSNSFTNIGGFSHVALEAVIPVILNLLCFPSEHFFPFLSYLTFNVVVSWFVPATSIAILQKK